MLNILREHNLSSRRCKIHPSAQVLCECHFVISVMFFIQVPHVYVPKECIRVSVKMPDTTTSTTFLDFVARPQIVSNEKLCCSSTKVENTIPSRQSVMDLSKVMRIYTTKDTSRYISASPSTSSAYFGTIFNHLRTHCRVTGNIHEQVRRF